MPPGANRRAHGNDARQRLEHQIEELALACETRTAMYAMIVCAGSDRSTPVRGTQRRADLGISYDAWTHHSHSFSREYAGLCSPRCMLQ